MATSYELWSFLTKFEQLSNSGVHAEMHLSCLHGRIWVNLHTELESSKHFSPSYQERVQDRPSPSQVRRRKRRRNARKEAAAARVQQPVDEPQDFGKENELTHTVQTDDVQSIEDSCLISFEEDVPNIAKDVGTGSIQNYPDHETHVASFDNFSFSPPCRNSSANGKTESNIIASTPTQSTGPGPSEIEIQMYRMLMYLTTKM